MNDKISGVILAGGSGTRFNGATKANINIGGKAIISRILDVTEGLFHRIIIVTNTPDQFKEYSRHKIIPDLHSKKGPLGGIHSAMKASSEEAIFVFPCDMPFLSKELILRQIEFYKSHNCEILIPRSGTYIEPLHAIYKVSLQKSLDEYLDKSNNHAVREFLGQADTRFIDFGEAEEVKRAFTNINSPDDILKAEKSVFY